MNVVDSSGWLEYFADGKGADFFAPAIENSEELLIPVISIYDVYKRLYTQRGRDLALEAVASMHLGRILSLNPEIAIEAAEISAEHKLPMADSLIYAQAKANGATLWTQDADLKGFPGVRFQGKKN